MSDKENCEVVDLKNVRAEKELSELQDLLAKMRNNEDELLSREEDYKQAFFQLSIDEQEEQRGCFTAFLNETERIKKARGTAGNKPSEELWLKIMAAFEANDVETLEELEKELL